ncbi:DUF4837 family protein [bacterium]|nr:DUF4837 family protein [bacterium]
MRTLIRSILFVLCLLIFHHCSPKPRSLWQEGVISVMAEDEDWEGIQGALRSTFEKVVRTPQKEYRFKCRHVPDSLIDYYSRAHFLIVASTLRSEGRIGDMIRNVTVDPSLRKSIEQGENFVFLKKNEWARNQVMMILVSNDITALHDKIVNHSIMLYDLMHKEMERYLTDEVLEGRENRKLETDLMDNYGWTLRIQKDYFIAEAFPADNFIWMRRVLPDRWIFIRWIDNGDISLLNQAWVVQERNRIGRTYYKDFSEQVADRYLFSHEGSFRGRPALITAGLWEHVDEAAGGPFKNYTFYDAVTERIYMIDIALFAPGKEKLPYLRRMEVIAETFRTQFDSE